MFHCFRVNTHSCSVLCRFDLLKFPSFLQLQHLKQEVSALVFLCMSNIK